MRSDLQLPAREWRAHDGTRLAYRELGEGRPLLLIHGFFSNAQVNWVRYGHAEALAAAGHRVILPDLRGHGDSAAPHDPSAYPADILTDDAFDLVAALGLADYDLGGYSLGARTAVRMLARGAAPRRVVIAGMGLEGILRAGGNDPFFRTVLTRDDFPVGGAEWRSRAFLKTTGADPRALLNVLATAVDTPATVLAAIRTPALVLLGKDDGDHGEGEALAAMLPHGEFAQLPGNHMSAVTAKALSDRIAEFLDRP